MASKKSPRVSVETPLRQVWLAGLGLLVFARREALTAASIALEEAGKFGERAVVFADQVEVNGSRIARELESRLGPVLEQLGIRQPKRNARASRKPAQKATRRGTIRKSAKRASKSARS